MKSTLARTHKVAKKGAEHDKLIDALAQIQTIQSELSSTQLVLDVLSQFTILMSQNLDFEHFCQSVAVILKKKLKFTYIHIWVFDGSDQLTLITPEKKEIKRTSSISKGVIGKTIREKKTIFVENVKDDPDYINVHRDTATELCIPLIFEGTLLGVMNIEAHKDEPLKEYIPLLEVISENLSYALRVAFLHGVEDQFKKLLEQMSEGLCVFDKEGRITYANPALLTFTGFELDDLIGKSYKDFLKSAQKGSTQIKLENKKVFTIHIACKRGVTIPALLTTSSDEDGNIVATITDVRKLTTAQQKLEETELLLASITHNTHEAIIGLDQDGIIQSWNVGAHRLFGYKESEVKGQNLDFLLHADTPQHFSINNVIEEARSKHYVKHLETLCAHKNGAPIEVALTANAIFTFGERHIGYAFFLRDISAQKKWEREIQDRFDKVQDAYREMGKQRRYLDYLSELISYSNTPGITRTNIANFIVNALMMITHANAATIRLYDKDEDRMVLTSYSGLSDDWLSKKYVPYKGSLVESAVKQGNPLKIFDVASNSQYYSPALARKNNLRSALIVPLTFQNEIIGSISLYVSNEGNLNLLDDDFISTFAGQAGLALKLVSE